MDYEAFGKVKASGGDGSIIEVPRFTGKAWDERVGLYYFNARWYDAGLGRFTGEDPNVNNIIRAFNYSNRLDGPSSEELALFSSNGLNCFSYCEANPIILVDTDGRIVGTAISALTGAIVGGASALIQGKNVAVGAAAGAVSGAIAGACVDIVVATGGAGAVVIAAAAVGGGIGSFAGNLTEQVGTKLAKGGSLKMAVRNIKWKEAGVSAAIGVVTGACGGAGGVAMDKMMAGIKGAVKASIAKDLVKSLETLIKNGASKDIVDSIIDAAIATAHQVSKDAANTVIAIEIGSTITYTTLEAAISAAASTSQNGSISGSNSNNKGKGSKHQVVEAANRLGGCEA